MLDSYQRFYADHKFSQERYEDFLRRLDQLINVHITYRICEMPVFVSTEFQKLLEDAATSIVEECVQPDYLRKAAPALHERYAVPNQNDRPLFSTVDFAIAHNTQTGQLEPKLIELQGFPSLYGYQYIYAQELARYFDLDPSLYFLLGGTSEEEYLKAVGKALLGDHKAEDTVLLEYNPQAQKTLPDFLCTERLWGVRAVDIRSVKKDGKTLFYERDGAWRPIRRIYNRAIVDELEEKNVLLPFAWNEELDVEWAGHPNWYFHMSKFSMPYLKHKSVPKTYFLNEISEIPADIENYVLKPLFAFAGKGVNVHPTRADVEAVPENERAQWILQERVRYAESIYTPEGMNKGEIRILLLWPPESPKPTPVTSLFRTGRGPMMGADYNKLPWTGTSNCFFGDADTINRAIQSSKA